MIDFLPDVPLPYAMQSNAYNTAYTQGYFVLGTQIMCMVSLRLHSTTFRVIGRSFSSLESLGCAKKNAMQNPFLQIQSNPSLCLSQNYTKFKKLKAHILTQKIMKKKTNKKYE